MLIGIVGKAGSGKSTVASILTRNHGFVEVSLAAPIKRMLREACAFTDEQLWGSSEARSWPDWRFPRTEVARAWLARGGGAQARHSIFSDRGVEIWAAAIRKEFGDTAAEHFLTVRHAAQTLGTEWGRACYGDMWLDKALVVAKSLLRGAYRHTDRGMRAPIYSDREGLRFVRGDDETFPTPEGIIIPDVRFSNEAVAISTQGGVIWKTRHGHGLEGAADQHESERHIDDIQADFNVPVSALETLPGVVADLLAQSMRGNK